MVTLCPPDGLPRVGLIDETAGLIWKVNSEFALLAPTGVVTARLTVPAAWAGAVAVIVPSLTTVTLVAAVPPNVTPVAPVKLLPVRVIVLPPAGSTAAGLTELTIGAA